ncbi:MAG: hypothetical protein KGV43_01165 [Arcobacter sp.]|nr:hypothetical protein [Arcobacter sp.]
MSEEEKIEELEEIIEDNTEENKGVIQENASEDENVDSNDTKTEEEIDKELNKKNKLKKILLIIISVLVSLIVVGLILYLLGFFEKETPKKMAKNIKVEKKEEPYKFNINDINYKKLNKKLEKLTNKEFILQEKRKKLEEERLKEEKKRLEEERLKEKKKLEEEKKNYLENLKLKEEKLSQEKQLIENRKNELEIQKEELEKLRQEALKLREEMLKTKESLEKDKSDTVNKVEIIETVKEVIPKAPENKFLMMINVAKIKGVLYKTYLDSITSINPNILLCRDSSNHIEIYYGPFDLKEERNILYTKLLKKGFKQAYKVELTPEEFDIRCNY